jgi:hypothetical protein
VNKPRPFDLANDADAIADIVRRAVAGAVLGVRGKPRFREAGERQQLEGMINGAMVGALGVLAACTEEASGRALRDELAGNMAYWFDRALEIMGREPLGDEPGQPATAKLATPAPDAATRHNALAGAVVRSIAQPILSSGGTTGEVMVATESVLVGISLLLVRMGGDDHVLDEMVDGARKRLAEARLRGAHTTGHA